MNIIGTFKQDGDAFKGNIQTLSFTGPVTFEPVKERANENTPDLRVFTDRAGQKARVQVGAAWKERSEAGKAYFSVRLDEPSFPAPIYCRLIQLDGQETHSLIWSRS